MKRWIALLLTVVLLLMLCACGSSDEIAVEPAKLPDEQAAEEPAELPAEELKTEPEEQNTRSVRRHLGDSDYNAVRQGNTIYFYNENKIGKMPVGGGLDDVEIIVSELTGSKIPNAYEDINEMQVVGDWIYLRTVNCGIFNAATDEIWRLRTDGTDLQKITSVLAKDEDNHHTFAVIGDLMYFPCETQEQLSASEYKYTTTLYRYDPDTGWGEALYQVTSDDVEENLIIFSYNENSLLLLDYSNVYKYNGLKMPTLLIYEYGADAPFVAPDLMQETWIATRGVFYDDMTNTGAYLAVTDGSLYRMGPDNGYIPEELPISLFTEEELTGMPYESDREIKNLLVVDADTYVYRYYCRNFGSGIRVYQNGTITDVNKDKGECFDYPGDGYLYYYCGGYCRVRPDGTQWEKFEWESIPSPNTN